jgi:hypothetical protein
VWVWVWVPKYLGISGLGRVLGLRTHTQPNT